MKTRARNLGGVGIAGAVMLVAAAVFIGGCCHVSKSCCKTADYTIVVAMENGECVVLPDDPMKCTMENGECKIVPDTSIGWDVHTGTTIKFVNTTDASATVQPTFGAYQEGNEFSIDGCNSTIRTVADLPVGTPILHVVKCGGDDHGGPKMVVTPPPSGG